jgi:zinc-ribbon domain
MYCAQCGTELRPEWKTCPKCGVSPGAPQRSASKPATPERRSLLGIVGIVGALFLLAILFAKSPPPQTANSGDRANSQPAPVPGTTAVPDTRPEAQRAVAEVASRYRDAYEAAPNELQKSAVRSARAAALKKALPSLVVANWQGRITDVGTTGKGDAHVTIEIGPKVSVMTWNNALSDISDHTLIPQGDPVYKVLSQKAKGDQVEFSGRLIPGGQDFIKETSMTEAGSMDEPEFLIKLSDAK